jgi:hypothetical protein
MRVVGLHHVQLRMPERLEAAGYTVVADETEPGRRVYVDDPFRNRLELLSDG